MIQQKFTDFKISPLAIRNLEFPGFEQDYLVLDSLLRTYKPKSVFEIGTNFGSGTNIICSALPEANVYSLDLPFGEGDKPLWADGKDHVGERCKRKYMQLRGDSTTFDYSLYPCEAYFCDATHEFDNVLAETTEVLKQNPKIVIYHDSDIPHVFNAICSAMTGDYELYRVTDTRISYLLRTECPWYHENDYKTYSIHFEHPLKRK